VALYRGRETGDTGMAQSASHALIHGDGLALAGSGVALVIAAIIAAVLVNARRGHVSASGGTSLH
jgi:hypothetical protein